MKDLIKEVLAQGNFGHYQTSALVLFVLLMLAVVVWIMIPGSKDYYNAIAQDIIEGKPHE